MAKPKLPKSTIECPDCKRASGFPLGDAKGFSRRRFLQVGATGLVASYFLDVLNPRLLGATRAPNVYMRNSASNAIFIFLAGAPSNIDMWDLKEGAWTPSDFAPASFNGNSLRFPQGLLPKTAEHLGRLSFVRSGLAWAAVHLEFLAQSSLRVSVFVQWVWTYVTGQRGSRLIVNHHGSERGKAATEADHEVAVSTK